MKTPSWHTIFLKIWTYIERCQRFRIMNVNYNSNKLGLKPTTDCVDLLIVMFVCTSCECEQSQHKSLQKYSKSIYFKYSKYILLLCQKYTHDDVVSAVAHPPSPLMHQLQKPSSSERVSYYITSINHNCIATYPASQYYCVTCRLKCILL